MHCSVGKGLEKFGDAKAVDASYKERSVVKSRWAQGVFHVKCRVKPHTFIVNFVKNSTEPTHTHALR